MADRDHTEISAPTKVCTGCGKRFPAKLEFFYAHPAGAYGLWPKCKPCARSIARARSRTPAGRASNRKWLSKPENLAKAREQTRIRARSRRVRDEQNKKRSTPEYRAWRAAYDKARYAAKGAEICARRRARRLDPLVRAREAANRRKPERIASKRAYTRVYIREKLKRDRAFKLKHRTATDIRDALKRRAGHCAAPLWWERSCGYTVADLRRHLELQFIDGMTWDNHGTLWEIDHVVPLAALKADSSSAAAFKKAWALSNLRPLLKHLNMAKGSKLPA